MDNTESDNLCSVLHTSKMGDADVVVLQQYSFPSHYFW